MSDKDEKKQEEPKKSWIKKTWKVIVATLAVFGIVWGVLEGVYFFTEEWHDYQEFRKNETHIEERIDRLEKNQKRLLKYYDSKKKSFAVGFRVVTITDDATGREVKQKTYRGWDGEVHTVYKDGYLSDLQGVDYYFWIDSDGEKNYCW